MTDSAASGEGYDPKLRERHAIMSWLLSQARIGREAARQCRDPANAQFYRLKANAYESAATLIGQGVHDER